MFRRLSRDNESAFRDFEIVRVLGKKARSNGTNDPSPVPLRLMKTPAAGHPLPEGEGG
jgi:hypothetical protein